MKKSEFLLTRSFHILIKVYISASILMITVRIKASFLSSITTFPSYRAAALRILYNPYP